MCPFASPRFFVFVCFRASLVIFDLFCSGGGVDLSRRLPRTYSLPSISIMYDKLSLRLDIIVAVLFHLSDA